MRFAIVLLALASLSACDRPDGNAAADKPTIAATPAALTFDGANATDKAGQRAHGERMSFMLGCKGCHGDDLQGSNVTANEPQFGDMWAPNLTLLMASYSDAEMERVIRKGVPK